MTLPPDPSGTPPADPANPLRRPRLRAPGAGRPRKSAALHLLHGTRSRAGRAPKPAPEKRVPLESLPTELLTPPKWMHRYAQASWRRLAPLLGRAGRLQPHYLPAFTSWCDALGRMERLQRKLSRMSVADEAYPRLHSALRAAELQVNTLQMRFGCDAAADARLTAIDGSSVAGGTPAPTAPAAAAEEDRGETWLREHGRGS
jgi:phage terminase small subunit